MIRLSMEIPTSMIKKWSPLTDLDFVIGTAVLRDHAYAEYLRCRPADRELIMDNGFHEEGVALELSDLLEAANRCRADYVISPDNVNDVDFTLQQYIKARSVLAGYKLAVVMTGFAKNSSVLQRDDFLRQVVDAEMLCCTFKLPQRLSWFQQSFLARKWSRVHLLGVSDLSELRAWNDMARFLPKISWSVDTGKCLKAALQGKRLEKLTSWRSNKVTTEQGLPSSASQKILTLSEADISPGCESLFRENVAFLRKVLA